MSFEGYLLRVGGDTFPENYIVAKSYKVSPHKRQDLDPYQDANGNLHRNVVEHRRSTVQFTVDCKTGFTNSDMETIMSFLRSRYTNEAERKVILTYYCPDTDSYDSGEFYLPNPDYTIRAIDGNTLYYEPMQLEFIEY